MRRTVRIAINYTPALRQGAGIGRYTRALVAALADEDAQNSYVLFSAGSGRPGGRWPANFRLRSSRLPERWLTILWQRLKVPFPAEALAGGCDLYHSPDFTLPPLASARGVVTVHDLSFMRVPECADPGLRSFLEAAVPSAVRRARLVIADSENTCRDLVQLLDVPPAKIAVVTLGVEPRFRRVTDTSSLRAVRERYRLPEHMILALGTLEPRKNYPRLISAFARLRGQGQAQHKLVIVGQRGWLYDDIEQRVNEEHLQGEVLFMGFVADEDLPALYSLADLFVYPSLYEGFGLPPLEAMACGTPVIAGDNSSLPEAVGEAGLLVDAEDVEALAAAMARVLEDGALRQDMSRVGPAHAAQHTWQRAARRLMGAYAQAMSG